MLRLSAGLAAVWLVSLNSLGFAETASTSNVIEQSIQCPSFKGVYQLKDRPVIDGWTLWLSTDQPIEIGTADDPGYSAQQPDSNAFIHGFPANKKCEKGRILLSCTGSTSEGYSYILNKFVNNAQACGLNDNGDGYKCYCQPGVKVPEHTSGLTRTKPQPVVIPQLPTK